ncbi:MAG TPA: phosphotyrosine protein phosphatase [Micromonosporaceae bacterium]|jgi:protein-tyrosine phosphatase
MSVFTILHVCVGNIRRSPMAERLLVAALRSHVGDRVDELYRSHGAGTGTWHVGEAMQVRAAVEVRQRGGDPSGFAARHLTADLIDESDLVLCATREQVARVLELRPTARGRCYVLGELGRLLTSVAADPAGTPADPATAHERGVALVAALDAVRAGELPWSDDDLDDPYGQPQREYARAADTIEATVIPLAAALVGRYAAAR